MFFYRAWIINDEEGRRGLESDQNFNPLQIQFSFEQYKWGYGVLLGEYFTYFVTKNADLKSWLSLH